MPFVTLYLDSDLGSSAVVAGTLDAWQQAPGNTHVIWQGNLLMATYTNITTETSPTKSKRQTLTGRFLTRLPTLKGLKGSRAQWLGRGSVHLASGTKPSPLYTRAELVGPSLSFPVSLKYASSLPYGPLCKSRSELRPRLWQEPFGQL